MILLSADFEAFSPWQEKHFDLKISAPSAAIKLDAAAMAKITQIFFIPDPFFELLIGYYNQWYFKGAYFFTLLFCAKFVFYNFFV